MNLKYYLLLTSFLYGINLVGQIKSINIPEGKNIYVISKKYSPEINDLLEKSNVYKSITVFSPSMIGNNSEINYKQLSRSLIRNFPQVTSGGLLCLDIENEIYEDIRKYNQGTLRFEKAISEFIKMIRFVKRERPNLDVGIYGIPFKITADVHKRNNSAKLDRLLREVDVIFPSLYLPYSFSEPRSKLIEQYLAENLNVALDFGIRLDKPVIPFIWYMVHPSNRNYGGELVSKDDFNTYMNKIMNFYNTGKGVQGVVYWEPSVPYFNRNVRKKNNIFKETERKKENVSIQSELIKFYLLK